MMSEKHNKMDEKVKMRGQGDESMVSIVANDDQENDAPLVFLCSKCNSVFGDSSSWVCANRDLRTVSLKSVTQKVKLSEKLKTSQTGIDIGSTFCVLRCLTCNEETGRVYKTTPFAMDQMRDIFTFYVEKLNSYQIGSADQQLSTIDDLISCQSNKQIQTELHKLQIVVVGIDKRLLALEEALQAEDESTAGTESCVEDTPKESRKLYPQHSTPTSESLSDRTETTIPAKRSYTPHEGLTSSSRKRNADRNLKSARLN